VKQKPAFKATKITEKQRLFISEYQVDFNGTRAVIRAGYSPKRASEMAYQLLQIPTVRQALDRAMEERLRKIGVRADRVLTEIARVAFSDLRKLYNEDGSLKLPSEWDDDEAAAIAGVEVLEEFSGRGEDRTLVGFTKKVRLFDKIKALELLSKHLGIIGNGKRKDEEEGEGGGRVLTTLELSAKIIYLVKLAAGRKKEIEAQKALGGKSQDEKPKELLK
jgi:phage terminase small subunit